MESLWSSDHHWQRPFPWTCTRNLLRCSHQVAGLVSSRLSTGVLALSAAKSVSLIVIRDAVIGLTLFWTIVNILRYVHRSMSFKRFAELNACLPVNIMPYSLKLTRYFTLSKIDANLLDDYLFSKYHENGLTHGTGTAITKTIKAICTIEPENFQAVLATKFDDWERPPFRAGAVSPFLKTGILTLLSENSVDLALREKAPR